MASHMNNNDQFGASYTTLTREAIQMANLDSYGDMTPSERVLRHASISSSMRPAVTNQMGDHLEGWAEEDVGEPVQPAYLEEPQWIPEPSIGRRSSRLKDKGGQVAGGKGNNTNYNQSSWTGSTTDRRESVGSMVGCLPLGRFESEPVTGTCNRNRIGSSGRSSRRSLPGGHSHINTSSSEPRRSIDSVMSSQTALLRARNDTDATTSEFGHEVSNSSSWKTASLWSSPYGVVAPRLIVGPNGDLMRDDAVSRHYAHGHGFELGAPNNNNGNGSPTGPMPPGSWGRTEAWQDDHYDHMQERKMGKSFPSMIPEHSMELEHEFSHQQTETEEALSQLAHSQTMQSVGSWVQTADQLPPSGSPMVQRPSHPTQMESKEGTPSTGVTEASRSDEITSTTLMLKHIPKGYSRDMLCELLDNFALRTLYDFVYLPVKFSSNTSFGYAFVNFTTVENAKRCHSIFDGFTGWNGGCEEPCEVSMQTKHRGLAACVELYRNSPVMHPSVPDAVKPALFRNGERIAYPTPTKRIKPPRARAGGDGAAGGQEQ